ncbi:Flagellar biosynthesis protein FlhA [Hyphomicrobium sulfonivorans]|uniref:Flagellar biosynthesis protein FlhA n=1 Tax=Hyphomicrobium sulfonivorans TaxID=121290 RepID=A0A109BEW3_HYPSL|nr:flagellar biosynthesis protein FlhA [Hyphomicrobium sulfonivorans]KWT67432.1 Flagellar biosynthesis protein FlhA [Hyphomicrobium sulfonivorans]
MAESVVAAGAVPRKRGGNHDVSLAIGIVLILAVLFLPLPAAIIDIGLAFSIALAVLVLMVALWIQRPLDFSAFPTVLLIATILRLALNIATTRLILAEGANGHDAAGHVIAGFSSFVMSGDFIIGTIVFLILITVNFIVITKGATRIAEVGARFTLDAIPGKQMAIDADLSAGLIDEKEAMHRRRELEEESSFFGSMDGASKFVRGDAIAGLIITAINIFGGIIIGVTRHDMSVSDAVDVFTKLSVGDGLVTQIPALIIALAAGLLVSKGGTRGSADKAVFGQLGNHPRALSLAAVVMFVLAVAPGLPFLPFAVLGSAMGFVAYAIPRRAAAAKAHEEALELEARNQAEEEVRQSVKESLKTVELELCLGKQISGTLLSAHNELAQRVSKMRHKFARQYGFVVPEIRLTDDLSIPPKSYQIKIHGTVVASEELRIGDVMVIVGDGPAPDVPGDEAREPAFGMKAIWTSEMFMGSLQRDGFTAVDNMSVLLTHLGEVIRNNLAQLLSYKDMRTLLDRLDPEYRRLIEEIIPSRISYSGLQAVLKLLLAERISIRNLHLILEAIAEIAPHASRAEQIAEHVRLRMAQQICGESSEGGELKVLRMGNRWELAFHQALRRDPKGEVVEFDIDPKQIEQFSTEATTAIRKLMDQRHKFVLVAAPDARPYVRMITERLFATLPVLSHLEIARGVQIKSLGTIS